MATLVIVISSFSVIFTRQEGCWYWGFARGIKSWRVAGFGRDIGCGWGSPNTGLSCFSNFGHTMTHKLTWVWDFVRLGMLWKASMRDGVCGGGGGTGALDWSLLLGTFSATWRVSVSMAVLGVTSADLDLTGMFWGSWSWAGESGHFAFLGGLAGTLEFELELKLALLQLLEWELELELLLFLSLRDGLLFRLVGTLKVHTWNLLAHSYWFSSDDSLVKWPATFMPEC